MANFILQLNLRTNKYQEEILNKRFEIGRHIFNSLNNVEQKKLQRLEENKEYRKLEIQLKKTNYKDKKLKKQRTDMIKKEYRLTEYDFINDIKSIYKVFSKNIDARTCQSIASNLWSAYKKYLYGNGKEIHYKKYGEFSTFEGNDNKTGIKYRDGIIKWNKLELKTFVRQNDVYAQESLLNGVKYCRLKREIVKSKYKYYVQLVFEGIPPIKYDKETGEIRGRCRSGDVGLDIGTQTIAIASDKEVKIIELADKVQPKHNELRKLQRKLDRSRRATNPDNFNENGTIKKGIKLKWNKSNHYKKIQLKIKELYRKQKVIRKQQHEELANDIISLGKNIKVEQMNFKGLAKRSKKTEKNSKGKFKRKKRFGKSIANRNPAMLLSIIDRKLKYQNNSLIKANTRLVRASQYNHIEETYKKKKLSQRWTQVGNYKLQRDMYSAYLIKNVNKDLITINKAKTRKGFNNFVKLHNAEVKRLTGKKNLSSIAI